MRSLRTVGSAAATGVLVRDWWWGPACLLAASCAPVRSRDAALALIERAEASACPAGLSQLGLTSFRPSAEVSAVPEFFTDSTIVIFEQGGFLLQKQNQGLNSLMGLMEVAGRPPAEVTALQLELIVTSPAPRTYAQRQLTLVVSDSERFTIPPSLTAPVRVHRDWVVERITFMVPGKIAMLFLRSRAVEGSLGTTLFRLSDAERDGLRSLVMYVLCGAR